MSTDGSLGADAAGAAVTGSAAGGEVPGAMGAAGAMGALVAGGAAATTVASSTGAGSGTAPLRQAPVRMSSKVIRVSSTGATPFSTPSL